MEALFVALRLYTRHAPFKRGRGVFMQAIDILRRRGWPSPPTKIGHGLTMEFEPSFLGWIVSSRGDWEPQQTAMLLEHLRPGAVVLDVGANTGYYALLAAARVGPGGQVHAFEIQPAIIEILRRNVARNGLQDVITVVAAGCWSAEGQASIESRGDPGSARISFSSDEPPSVPLTTIDRYVTAHGLAGVEFILIDTEGADFEVLKGAAAVLGRFRPVVMAEVHHVGVFGGSEDEMRLFMAGLGYTSRPVQSEFSRDVLFLPSAAESLTPLAPRR